MERNNLDEMIDELGKEFIGGDISQIIIPTYSFSFFPELKGIMNREVGQLSGGELQRFAIGVVAVQKANV